MQEKCFTTVIVGMGRMGKTRYKAMTENGGFEVVAICDTNTELLAGYDAK